MSIRTTNFDAVAAAAPLNREASTVRDGSGDLWEPKIKATTKHWNAPPPPEAERPEDRPDLSGRVIDRLTVIRYHGPRKGGFWLVRCACGDYELRRSKFIENPPPRSGEQVHACAACDYLHHIRWKAKNHAVAGRQRMRADEALLDRLAAPQSCAPCKSPFTCAAQERCAIFHGEA